MTFAHHSVIGLVACLLFCSCDRAEGPSAAPAAKSAPKVAVWETTPGPMLTRRSWPATVEPMRVLEIVAPANGRLIGTSIETGTRLESGEPMMKLLFPEGEAAREALARRAEVLQQEVTRLEELAKSRAVSDAAAAAVRIDKLETLSRLHAIEALIKEGAILAPVAGTVLETLVSPGSPVVEGTVLARLADAASQGVRLEIPNPELRHFESVESLAVVAGESHPIHRIVRYGGLRPNTTRLEIWLVPDADITTPAAATVIHESSREALLIPWSAVATDDERAWVGRVDAETNEVRRVGVVLGETSGTRVEVVDGLSSGDRVLRHDPRTFADGAVVDPEPAAPSADR